MRIILDLDICFVNKSFVNKIPEWRSGLNRQCCVKSFDIDNNKNKINIFNQLIR